jgi:transposase
MQNSTARKAKQVELHELIIGVDAHKRMHWLVMMTAQGEVIRRLKVKNSFQDFEYLRYEVEREAQRQSASGVKFAIEVGGHYWANLGYYLLSLGYEVRLISPLTLKRVRDGMDLCKRKNDFRDALAAGELLISGCYCETRPPSGPWAELRSVHQGWWRLKQERASALNLLRCLLDGVFPEFCCVFSDPFGLTARAVLMTYTLPSAIKGLGEDEFVRGVRSAYRGGRLAVSKLRALYWEAPHSIGIEAGAGGKALEIRQLVERLSLIESQVEELEEELKEMVRGLVDSRFLTSIPGLGLLSIAGILAEIGPIENYGDAKDLIKLAGTNPVSGESGGKAGRYTPMSKKGRAVLRHVLWQAALRLVKVNEEFREWAQVMREREGYRPLNQRVILGAAMNKLLRLVYALLSKKEMYRPKGELSLVA